MDMTAEFIVGLGRTFKAVREREGLTQQELAERCNKGMRDKDTVKYLVISAC